MGEAGHHCVGMGFSLVEQGRLQIAQGGLRPVDGAAHPETKIERHLVVARAGGVEATGGRADQLSEPRLDVQVDVFIGLAEDEITARDFVLDTV